jgi:hypothetical protein
MLVLSTLDSAKRPATIPLKGGDMTRKWLGVLAIAALCSTSAVAEAPSAEEITLIKRGVVDHLKDPESARFGKLVVGPNRKQPGVVVCGQVNARNSFGGYTGMQPFMGFMGPGKDGSKGFWLFTLGNDASTAEFLIGRCKSEGAPL